MTVFTAEAAATTSTGGGNYSFLVILALAAAAFWFMSSRSRKQQKAQADVRNNLEIGDQVMTASGMLGTVVGVDDDGITLEAEPGGGRTKWVRQAIAKKIEPPVADDEAWEDEAADDDTVDEDEEPIEVPDDLSSLPPARKDDEPDQK